MLGNTQASSKLQDLKHFGEAAWVETHAIATGLGTALKSGVVVKGGGLVARRSSWKVSSATASLPRAKRGTPRKARPIAQPSLMT